MRSRTRSPRLRRGHDWRRRSSTPRGFRRCSRGWTGMRAGSLARCSRPAASSPRPIWRRSPGLVVAGDLPAGLLADLARAAGIEPGVARMARRLLLWAREQAPGQPLTDLARLPAVERAPALRQAFTLWRETDSVAELEDLD